MKGKYRRHGFPFPRELSRNPCGEQSVGDSGLCFPSGVLHIITGRPQRHYHPPRFHFPKVGEWKQMISQKGLKVELT